MDAVDSQCAVFVDLFDGIFDTGFLEVFFLLSCIRIERLFVKRIREDPVFGDDLAELTGALRRHFWTEPC